MGCPVSWPRLKRAVQWLCPVPHPQSHASEGSGAFFGMDNLDPIAIRVLFEEWDPQTESIQHDQAGVCSGETLHSRQTRTRLPFLGDPVVNLHGSAWYPTWGSWAEEGL